MSDTPRTDAVAMQLGGPDYYYHLPETLERELAAVTKERDETQKLASTLIAQNAGWKNRADRMESERDELRAKLEAQG